jgi:hypothetical protein
MRMDYSNIKNINMKYNIKNLIGIAIVLISQGITAQFYAGVQAGVGNIQSNVESTVAGHRLGGAVKAGYIYSFTNHIGIGTGLEFSQYKQQVYLNSAFSSLTSYEIDPSTSAFIYTITAKGYKEEQTLHAIQIPLFLQYKTNINKGIDFNFRAGVKYFLPVNYKIKATADYVNGAAYYPDVNLNIDDLPEYGLGSQSNYSASGEYETKGIIMSSFELGFTFDMGKKNALYTALFLENGYGSILDQEKDESIIGYNSTSVSDRKTNGIYSTDKNAEIKPVGFGLTLGWNF